MSRTAGRLRPGVRAAARPSRRQGVRDAEVPVAQALHRWPRQPRRGLRPDGRVDADEVTAHIDFQREVGRILTESGEFVDAQALSPHGAWVRYGGPDAAPVVTDGPFPETKELIAGWYMIDVESEARAHEVAAWVSSAPGKGGEPIYEWLEVRPVMDDAPAHTSDRGAAAGARPAGARCPGPARRRLRVGRGRRPGGADRGPPGVGRAAPRPAARLAGHRRPAQAGRPPAVRGARRRREEVAAEQPRARADGAGRRHAAADVPVLPPGAEPGLGGRAHAAGRRRADHQGDRGGVPGARGDDGAADLAGRSGRSPVRRSRHRPTSRWCCGCCT